MTAYVPIRPIRKRKDGFAATAARVQHREPLRGRGTTIS